MSVEDGTNYERYWDEAGPPFLGGEGFEYVLTVTSSPFAPVELGRLDPGDPALETSGTVEAPGDTVYFRVETTAEADVTLSLTRTGADAFCPVLSPLNTSAGQLLWSHSECRSETGMTERFFDYYPLEGFDLGSERVFVVLDWYGEGGVDYTFDLTITAE